MKKTDGEMRREEGEAQEDGEKEWGWNSWRERGETRGEKVSGKGVGSRGGLRVFSLKVARKVGEKTTRYTSFESKDKVQSLCNISIMYLIHNPSDLNIVLL